MAQPEVQYDGNFWGRLLMIVLFGFWLENI